MDKKIVIGFIALIVLVLGGIYWLSAGGGGQQVGSSEENIAFAQCLSDEGAKFYGAWWCPHCNEQKGMFGKEAMEEVDYVECSTPDGNNQTQVCTEKEIESYPTWIFADGSRLTGVQSFEALAEKTSCTAPGASEESGETTEQENATSSDTSGGQSSAEEGNENSGDSEDNENASTSVETQASTTVEIEAETERQ